ncbi:porin [Chondrinema litorale]|uniref:porin n=1 Tax=Chondrinema litorale TaxID=2994555 RepID=UPI0025427C4B|nr:porin [Chondrinema litorale]UZR97632.1 porin [Chondrinema litorale]
MQAQGSDIYGSGLKINLNDEGSKYVRFLVWSQFWLKVTDNNPGTIVNNTPENTSTDIGIRRSRFLTYAQIAPRFIILSHWGINNQSYINGGVPGGSSSYGGYGPGKKPHLFLHDAYVEYTVISKKLYIGSGLHYWNGLSRLSQGSTLSFLTIDAPIFNWPLIETTDQFGRQIGMYAKGDLGKVEYHLALNKPFSSNSIASSLDMINYGAIAPSGDGVAVNAANNSWALQGYAAYQFWDKESNLLPFRVGTYLGTKKVLNIGAGFHYHPSATASSILGAESELVDIENHNINLFSADIFCDTPIGENGSAITLYGVYYNYDFGPDYLRNVGILNIAQTGGNTQPTIGTGEIFYAQAGYALPKMNKGMRLQPFGAYTYKNFEALNSSSGQFDLGMNLFLEGHHSKITLQYSTRPVYNADGNRNDDDPTKDQLTLQATVYL